MFLAVLLALAACGRPRGAAKPSTAAAAAAAAATATAPLRRAATVTRPSVAPREGSPVLLADVDGKRLAFVADEDESRVRVIDVDDSRELASFAPGGIPASLLALRDGRIVVALRDAAALAVLRVTTASPAPALVEDVRIAIAPEPVGLALSPDEEQLVVTSGWGRRVTVLETATFAARAEYPVGREPRGVVVSADGTRAFVAHAVGPAVDVVPLTTAGPPGRILVNGAEETLGRFAMFNSDRERSACQGFALARTETGRILAPHVLAFSGEPEPSSGYGGDIESDAELFHVPVIDVDAAKVIPESAHLRTMFRPGRRCALPRAAVAGKAGLYVTCLGENTVELFDADVVNPHDVGLRSWGVPAGPIGIALDEEHDRAFVWSQFAHTLTTIPIGEQPEDGQPHPLALTSLTLLRADEDPKVERGRIVFHSTQDRRISGDGRACASCHPDGRDDTLVWSSPKGPRQTPMLAGRLEGAAPFGWNGDAPDVSRHLVQTVKRLGGGGLEGEDKEALIAYLRTMRSPAIAASRTPLSDRARRGEAIFRSDEAGCASCHGPSGDLPDGTAHDVKSHGGTDLKRAFDTPSLRFVGGSAPYFHDGRYPDLRALLVKSDGKMGHTKHLSPSELGDLEAYLETL